MSSSGVHSGGNFRTSAPLIPRAMGSTPLTTSDSSAFMSSSVVPNGQSLDTLTSHHSQKKVDLLVKVGGGGGGGKDGKVAMVIKPMDSSGLDKEEEINVEEVEPKEVTHGKPTDTKKHSIILSIKKNSKDRNNSSYSTFQDTGKNDSYCWVCHEGGEVLCCDKCPRVFHFKCTKLDQEPEGEEWFCPVCFGLSKKIKKTRPSDLKDCLMLAVNRMMLPGTDLFQTDVSPDLREEYRQLVFHPLHLGMIKEKVLQGAYSTTRDFLADTEWIHHNCIIFNGARHELTKIAKNIIRQCQNDMKEIELASCCFKNMAMRKDWFEVPCSPPHDVVLAKVNRYPFWPAKLINMGQDKCDVRFFGQHDRAIVPRSSVQEFRGTLPTPPSLTAAKQKEWVGTVAELKRYLQNVHSKSGIASPSLPPTVQVEPPTSVNLVPNNGLVRKEQTSSVQTSGPVGSHSNHATQGASVVNGGVGENTTAMDTTETPVSLGLQRESDTESEGHTHDSDQEDQDFVPHKGRSHKVGGTGGRSSQGGVTRVGTTTPAQGGKMAVPKPPMPPPPRTSPSLPRKRNPPVQAKKPKKQSLVSPPTNLASNKLSGKSLTSNATSSALPNSVVALGVDKTAKITPTPVTIPAHIPSTQHIAHVPPQPSTQAPPSAPPPQPVLGPVQPSTSQHGGPLLHPQQLPEPQALSDQVKNVFSINTHPAVSAPSSSHGSRHNPLPPSPLPVKSGGDGLLSKTINTIGSSAAVAHKVLAGPSNDMGYHHYSERLMSAVQLVLLEMLADFHTKGKEGAKAMGDQLLSSWPISPSHRMVQELRVEMRNELDQRIDQVKTAAKLDSDCKLQELRKQFEQEKKKAIEEAVNMAVTETKKKHWCSYCSKEAAHYCCWNANYCSEECQNNHWLDHQKQCLNPQITGMSSATQSDVSSGRMGVSVTPNLMSPVHDGKTNQVFSFSSSGVPVPPSQSQSTLPAPSGVNPPTQAVLNPPPQAGVNLQHNASATESESLSHSTLMSNVVMATSIPHASIPNPGIALRSSIPSSVPASSSVPIPSSVPLSPNLQVAKSSPSLHSNPSSVSTSGSSLTTHSESNPLHPTHSDTSSNRIIPGHPGDHRHGLAEPAQLQTPQTPLYWPYQQPSSRYPGGFPLMMYPTDANLLFQQQLIGEQQNTAGGSGTHQ